MADTSTHSFVEACRKGDLSLVQSIMQDYNEFEAQQKRHVYPDTLMKRAVYEAACGNHASVVALLPDNGASVTDSVVMAVYRGRDKTILKEILKRGFEINTVEPGASLLTFVPTIALVFEELNTHFPNRLSVGHIEWMEVLLHHGADPNVKGSRGKTALHSAVIQPSLRPCQLLLDHSARLPRDILQSAIGCTGASMEMIKFLVDKGADLSYVRNIKTGYKIWQGAPLHVVARTNGLDIAQLLLSAGADPSVKYWDDTPADTAKEFDYVEMYHLLKMDVAPDRSTS